MLPTYPALTVKHHAADLHGRPEFLQQTGRQRERGRERVIDTDIERLAKIVC
eukprot:COSAG03_NODE_15551_length_427_cov_2.134146_1_plen_51_part_01